MLKLAIDFEHPSRRWWENGGQSLWEGILDDLGGSSVVLDDHVAQSWIAAASRIPGWADGPEYAPHPVRAAPVDEEDPDL